MHTPMTTIEAMETHVERVTTYHAPTPEAVRCHGDIRAALGSAMLTVLRTVPESREKSLALTKLEEAMFWANAGIAREISARG